jgi:tRNA dimethylallyltransferase
VEIVAIFGPTGVGKTAVAVAVGQRLRRRGEDPLAISADALQVYRGLEALTGAAGPEERAALEHRLLGVVPVSESFSAGRFAELAHSEIDAALTAGRRPFVVGGTGLYLRAALCELDLRPPPPAELRARIGERMAKLGPEALHAELRELSPTAAAAIDPADRTRVGRALELVEMGEQPVPAGDNSALWARDMRRPTRLFGLTLERQALYERIDRRVDELVAAGAAEEVRRAEAEGASHTARKALGYAELLAGDVEAMKRRSRQLARRQLTWMRKLRDVRVIDVTERPPEEAAAEVEAEIGRR